MTSTKDGIALTPLFYVQQGMSSTHSTYFCVADSLAEVKEAVSGNPLIIKEIDTKDWSGDFGKMARKKLMSGAYNGVYMVYECELTPIATTEAEKDKVKLAFFTEGDLPKNSASKCVRSETFPSRRYGRQYLQLEKV